jgi:hypothetical protein
MWLEHTSTAIIFLQVVASFEQADKPLWQGMVWCGAYSASVHQLL